MKPFLILETGAPIPALRRHGGFGHWIRVAAGLHGRQVRSCFVAEGEPLPDAADHAGVLVTGSGAMVTERADWSERSAHWLREAAQARYADELAAMRQAHADGQGRSPAREPA